MAAQNHLCSACRTCSRPCITVSGLSSGAVPGGENIQPFQVQSQTPHFPSLQPPAVPAPAHCQHCCSTELVSQSPSGSQSPFCSGFVFTNKSAPGKLGTKPPPLFYNQNPLEQPGWCPLAQFRAQYGSCDIPVRGKGLNSTNIHRPVPKNPAGGLKGAGAETGWSPLCMDKHSSGLHES